MRRTKLIGIAATLALASTSTTMATDRLISATGSSDDGQLLSVAEVDVAVQTVVHAEPGTFSVLPAVLPDDAESGTIDTAYGPARWVRVIRGAGALPAGIDYLLPGPTGLLGFSGVFCDDADSRCPGLWAADDILAPWEGRPLPVEAPFARLDLLDGTYWLTTLDPEEADPARRTTIWRSADATSWQQVDTGELRSPGFEAFGWEPVVLGPVGSGGVTLLPIVHRIPSEGRVSMPTVVSALGIRAAFKGADGLQPTDSPGTYRVIDERRRDMVRSERRLGRVRLEGGASGVRVTKPDGTLISELEGLHIADLRRWLASGIDTELGIIEGDRITAVVEAPWNGMAADWANVVGAADGFHAFVTDVEGGVSRWHSADGREWAQREDVEYVPSRRQDAGCRLQRVSGPTAWEPGPAFVAWSSCSGPDLSMESDDGETWSPRPRGPADDDPKDIMSGLYSRSSADEAWWLHVDDQWRRAPEIEGAMRLPARCRDADYSDPVSVLGDSIVVLRYSKARLPCPRTIRVLEFGAAGS